jgi:hypothetical protein
LIILATAAGALFWATQALDSLLIFVSAAVLALPLASRAQSGTFDIFEVYVPAAAALAIMFVVRPAADLITSEISFRGYDVGPGFTATLVITTLACGFFAAGYEFWRARWKPAPVPRAVSGIPSTRTDNRIVIAPGWVLALTAVSVIALVYVAHKNGFNPLTGWLGGGHSGYEPSDQEATAYIYLLPFVGIPATLLWFVRYAQTRNVGSLVAGTALTGVMLLATLPGGRRLWAMLLLLPLIIFFYVRHHHRPRVRWVLCFAVLLTSLLPFLGELQPRGSSVEPAVAHSPTSPIASMGYFLTGPDTGMFDALVLERQVVPRITGFHPASSLESVATQAVPRSWWPQKPYRWDAELNQYLFANFRIGKSGTAFSLIGGLYYDAGPAGVIAGMIALGALLAAVDRRLRLQPTTPLGQATFAMVAPLVVVLLRGDLADTLSRAFFVLLPLLIAATVSRQRAPRSLAAVGHRGSRVIAQARFR